MEATEGNVRATTRPEVTIGDKTLESLVRHGDVATIQRAILELMKRVDVLRRELDDANNQQAGS